MLGLRFKLILILGLIFGSCLSACGKTDFNRDQAKVDAGNVALARMSAIRESLREHNLVLMVDAPTNEKTSTVSEMKTVVSECSQATLQVLKPLTAEYRALSQRILKLVEDQDVTYAGDLEALKRSVRLADLLSEEIEDAIRSRN